VLPKNFAVLGVKGAEQAIRRPSGEEHTAGRREHRAPVLRRQVGGPGTFARVDIPRLQLANVIGAGTDAQHVCGDAGVTFAGYVFYRLGIELRAKVFVRRDVDQSRFRVEGGRWPILAAPQARAECCELVGAGLVIRVDDRTARAGLDTLEYIVADVVLPGDEVDLAGSALKLPKVPVA